MNKIKDKLLGSLWGLIIGDALGIDYEFVSRENIKHVSDKYNGSRRYGLKPGMWSDDSIMTLCATESLIEKEEIDFNDMMDKWISWKKNGYMSPTGNCFDIGYTTNHALFMYERTNTLFSGSNDERSSGNGGIMRFSPIVVKTIRDPIGEALETCQEYSDLTHPSQMCQEASIFMTYLLRAFYLIQPGQDKKEIIRKVINLTNSEYLKDVFTKTKDQIKSTGFVRDSLEASLWGLINTNTYLEGLLLVISLGDDTDTIGAIYGQLAGAYYGFNSIPKYYSENLYNYKMIEEYFEKLIQQSLVKK